MPYTTCLTQPLWWHPPRGLLLAASNGHCSGRVHHASVLPLSASTTIGDAITLAGMQLTLGAAFVAHAPTKSIGRAMTVNTGALPSEFAIIKMLQLDAYNGGASVASPNGPKRMETRPCRSPTVPTSGIRSSLLVASHPESLTWLGRRQSCGSPAGTPRLR